MDVLLTFLVGGVVGFIFYKLKFPGGMMFGAICGTIVLSVTLDHAAMPYAAKFFAQITAGAFIGCSVSREDIKQFRQFYKPALAVVVSLFGVNLLAGALLTQIAHLDVLTALLCAVPGGMSNVALIAADMGADMSAVVVLQFVRLCVGIGVFPAAIAFICGGGLHQNKGKKHSAAHEKEPLNKKTAVAALGIAAAAGLAGRKLGVPAGALVFSLLAVMLFNVSVRPVKLPKTLKRFTQILSGTYIGCSIPRDSLLDIHTLILPAGCVCMIYMVNAWLVAKILDKTLKIPMKEGMLMATPAGAADMALISSDIGVESSRLIIVHVVRMFAAVTVFPQLCYQIAGLF